MYLYELHVIIGCDTKEVSLFRFRVLDGTFCDTTPTCPETEATESEDKVRKIPYYITVSLNCLYKIYALK